MSMRRALHLAIGVGLCASLVGPLYAQPAEAAVEEAGDAAGQAPAEDPGPGDLFRNPEGGEGENPRVAIDPDTPMLNLEGIVEIAADAGTSRYRLTVERSGFLTVLLDAPVGARVSVRDPQGDSVLDMSLAGGFNDPFNNGLVFETDIEGGGTIMQTPMYQLAEPGDYLVEITLPRGNEEPAKLGAGLILNAEDQEADAEVEPIEEPVDTPPEETPALPAMAWQQGQVDPNSSTLWYKIEVEKNSLCTIITRASGGADLQLMLFRDGQFQDAIAYADSDPFGEQGNETIIFSAEAEQTYYLKIYGRRHNAETVSAYLMPMPEALPEAEAGPEEEVEQPDEEAPEDADVAPPVGEPNP